MEWCMSLWYLTATVWMREEINNGSWGTVNCGWNCVNLEFPDKAGVGVLGNLKKNSSLSGHKVGAFWG